MSLTLENRREKLLAAFSNNISDETLQNIPDSELETIAAKAASVVPTKHLGQVVGPVYSTQALVKALGITKQAIAKRVKNNQLLAVRPTDQNILLFPAFQFDGTSVKPEILKVLGIFDQCVSGAVIAHWLNTPIEVQGFESRTPLEFIEQGNYEVVESKTQEYALLWK